MDEEELVAKAARVLAKKDAFTDLKPLKEQAYYDVRPETKYRGTPQQFFERVINAAHLSHMAGHGLSAPAVVAEDRDLPLEQVRELLQTPRFKQAAEARGIPAADTDYLTTEMVMVLQTVTDPSLGMTERQRVQKLGIKWTEFQGWLKYPPFRAKYKELMTQQLKVGVERGDRVLAQLIDEGNLNAIMYANEKTGVYVRGSQEQTNVMLVIRMVMSTLQRHVTDPAILRPLVEDLKILAAGGDIGADEIVVEAEIVPDVLNTDAQHGTVEADPGDERTPLDNFRE